MADISKCADNDCPSRVHCYLYRAVPNEYRQSYMMFERNDKERCDAYVSTSGWDDRSLVPVDEIEEKGRRG